VHLPEDISLYEELVKTKASLLGTHLLDGSEEGVRLVQSVQEADGLVDGGWVVLPHVKQLKSLLQVIEPGSKASGSHPGFLHPLSADFVEEDVLHEIFHSGCHGQLSLKCELEILKVDDDLGDKSVDQLALLQVYVLVRSASVVSQLGVNLINGELLSLNLDFIEYALREFSCDIHDGGCTLSRTSTLGLEFHKDRKQLITLGSSEVDFSVGMHSEGEGSLWGKLSLNMLDVLIVSSSNGALERSSSFGVREKFSFIKELLVEEMVEVGLT